MKRNKVLSLFGLATRAGKIKSGSFLTEQAVKAGKAYLVLIAGDASENTKKKLSNMCSFYEVPARFYADQDTLGHAIGKEFRVSVTVTDAGFADEIEKQLKTEEERNCI